MLWGASAAILRFIPYAGPGIGAAFPVALAVAIFPGWTTPALTLALFVILELVCGNVVEPWLYGSRTGVTPIALILAALFWTWLWGPVGLLLATPMTVCLVVLGRHIPRLAFLGILLSDEQALTPAEDCCHRLFSVGLKLRAAFPAQKILVGLWGLTEGGADADSARRVRDSGADVVVNNLADTISQLRNAYLISPIDLSA